MDDGSRSTWDSSGLVRTRSTLDTRTLRRYAAYDAMLPVRSGTTTLQHIFPARRTTGCAFALLLCLGQVPSARAQVLYGSLIGNVTAPSSGAVAGPAGSAPNRRTRQVLHAAPDERALCAFRRLQE